jgi:FMN phosphatase YigB (HAD superfamily)
MENVKKLSVFDFDGTLVDTPTPVVGKTIWKLKKGEDWPYQGWWGRNESLDMSVFDMPVIEKTIESYREEISKSDTLVIMLTGRTHQNSGHVKSILDSHGLKFHKYLFKRGGDTLIDKVRQLESLLKELPNLEEIEMWDDRTEHIPHFIEWGEKLSPIKFKMNVVPSNHHE